MENFCSQCGKGLVVGQRFCASCGRALAGAEPLPKSDETALPRENANARTLLVKERRETTVKVSVIRIAVGVALGVLLVMAGIYGVPWAANKTAQVAYEDAKVIGARNDVIMVAKSCEQYLLQKSDKCPRSTEDLRAAGVVSRAQKDPWGEEFVIKCPGEHGPVDVMSTGPDRKPGGGDDLGSWEK